MILTMLEIGMSSHILAVRGRDSVKKHLGGLGFVPGGEVAVVAESGGNLIVAIKGARIALDKQLACKIVLEGLPCPVAGGARQECPHGAPASLLAEL